MDRFVFGGKTFRHVNEVTYEDMEKEVSLRFERETDLFIEGGGIATFEAFRNIMDKVIVSVIADIDRLAKELAEQNK